MEIALKTALLSTGKAGVLAFDPGYHGLSLGALAATSRSEFREPFEPRLAPHVERVGFGAPIAEIAAHLEGDSRVGAVIVEPIVGREGVLLPPAGWLTELAQLCRDTGTPWIGDEIFTGFGRTGRLFAVDHDDLRPDILCFGKALGGGLPIAAAIGRRELMDAWHHAGEARHTATFVANPLACATALATLDILDEEDLIQRSQILATHLRRRLRSWSNHPNVHEVRGRGLLWGIEMKRRAAAKATVQSALESGVLLLAGGPEGKVIQIVPPLVITGNQLDTALEVLESAL